MKIPKSIQILIYRTARHRAIANKANEEIRNWLEHNNLYNDTVIDQLIDSCEQSSDPEGFIKYLENIEEHEYGNNDL